MGGKLDIDESSAAAAGTGRTGDLLRAGPVSGRFEGTERAAYVLTNEKHGLKREDDDGGRVFEPAADCGAVLAVTDERLLFVVGGAGVGGTDDYAVSIPYTEVRSIETREGLFRSRVTVTTRISDRYKFRVAGGDDLPAVEAFVRDAVTHWVTVDRQLERARDTLAEIDDRIEAGEPEAAAEAVARTRSLLTEAEDVVDEFDAGGQGMARQIEHLSTRLTQTELRAHRRRADQLAAAAEQRRRRGDSEGALERYVAAQSQYDRAIALASDGEYFKVEEIREERSAVTQALAQLSAEPLVAAADASITAVQADEPAVEAWRRALETCHDVAGLLARHGEHFDGDPDALRMQVEWAAGNLLSAHRTAAEQAEARAEECREAGDAASARQAYRAARDHLRRARDVAAEFRTGDPAPFERERERLADALADVGREPVAQ
ncbi:MAG: PH domain-containing protein [Haloarculaceae archaeon]